METPNATTTTKSPASWYHKIKDSDPEKYALVRATQNEVSKRWYEAKRQDPQFRAAGAARARARRAASKLGHKESLERGKVRADDGQQQQQQQAGDALQD
jgi:hypothetical protein